MDRIAFLSAEAAKTKRKRARHGASSPVKAAQQQQRLVAKAAVAMGKLQRTDTEHNQDEQPTADAGTQDSVQTVYSHNQHLQQQIQQQQPVHSRQQSSHPAMGQQLQEQQQSCQHSQQQLEAQEDFDGSGSEVEGPVADDKYIKGTRLVINGWFQACRGCNEPTAHTTLIARRDVPLCPRCQGKYLNMINGCYPPSLILPDPCIEPLHYWLPRVLGPVPPLSALQRRDFCDSLVLRQDDAWLQLIQIS